VYASVGACRADAAPFAGTGTQPTRGQYVKNVPVNTDGTVPPVSHTFPEEGMFWWAAFFSGDANNNRAVSNCALEPVEVFPSFELGLTSVFSHLSESEIPVGGTVSDQAFVLYGPGLPLPAGAVVDYRIYDNEDTCGDDAVAYVNDGIPPSHGISAGTAGVDPATGYAGPVSYTFTRTGTHYWEAFFSDGTGERAVSGCGAEPEVVSATTPSFPPVIIKAKGSANASPAANANGPVIARPEATANGNFAYSHATANGSAYAPSFAFGRGASASSSSSTGNGGVDYQSANGLTG
jgi:hypothetical protein